MDADYYDSLYCLEDYSSYTISGSKPETEIYTLRVSFDVCQGARCHPRRYEYLQSRTFHMALGVNRLDLYGKKKVTDEFLEDAIIYPY